MHEGINSAHFIARCIVTRAYGAAGAREDNLEFSVTAVVRYFYVYHRVWSPHLGQRLFRVRTHIYVL